MSSEDRKKTIQNVKAMFHKKQEAEDALPKSLIKAALKSGNLNLSGRALAVVPDQIWNLEKCDVTNTLVDLSLDSAKEEDTWWTQKPLTYLDLSSNTLLVIPKDIRNLTSLVVLRLQDNSLTTIPKEIGQLNKLTKVDLSRNKITVLPKEFFLLAELKYLNLSYNNLTEIHPDVNNLFMLEFLDISHNSLKSLPDGIGFLVRLTELILSFNELTALPDDIVSIRCLRKLEVMNNKLKQLPKIMSELRRLECVYAQHNRIVDLPDFSGCECLKELHISDNCLKEILEQFCESLPHLKILDLRDNEIEKLPKKICMLQSLIRLDVSNNAINTVPASLATLKHLISLQLNGNPIRTLRRDIIENGTTRILKTLRDRLEEDPTENINIPSMECISFPDRYQINKSKGLVVTGRDLVDIPDEVFQNAGMEKVQLVDLSKNRLREVPNGLCNVGKHLMELNLSQNLISEISNIFPQFEKVVYIDISQNHLKELPDKFGTLITLKELNLSYNKFKDIPNPIYNLQSLEILLLRNNLIEDIDVSRTALGSLKLLTRLDLANNSINHIPPILGKLTNIKHIDLTGNPFRYPRHQILESGTEKIMSYLRDRIPQ